MPARLATMGVRADGPALIASLEAHAWLKTTVGLPLDRVRALPGAHRAGYTGQRLEIETAHPQEALTNVERHAEARRVRLEVEVLSKAATLCVSDDGKGLPPDAAQHPRHYGLRGMRERVEGLGGTLAVSSGGPGTTLTAELPIVERPRPPEARPLRRVRPLMYSGQAAAGSRTQAADIARRRGLI